MRKVAQAGCLLRWGKKNMPPLAPIRKPVDENLSLPLDANMKNADPLQAQIISEQRKEIARLQKLLAKTEVKKDSEIAGLKAKLAEEKKNKVKVIVDRYCGRS